jgi:5,10-methylenetetrahydrofolate reductase
MTDKIFSDLMKAIKSGKLVLTGELEPERTSNIEPTVEEAKQLKAFCVAANVTDNPKSTVCLSSLSASYLTQEKSGLEIVYQLTCRDQNRMGLGAALLGAASLGLKNVLALTGDHNACGDMPKSKPVFDYDSTHLIQLVREMVDNRSIEGLKLAEDCPDIKMHVGGAANPNANPLEPEILHIQRKAKAGVEFIQTQVVYDIHIAETFLKEIKSKTGVPVLLGIFPMKNYGTAKGFDEMVPGVKVPQDLLARFKAVKDANMEKAQQKEAYIKLNVDFFTPMLKELKKKGLVTGVHIMAVHYPNIFKPLLDAVNS